ncbi:nuclear transport factor 2 family protein [Vibrio sagamiensis]|uniref:nuclear transport factor 2 family protein n=1 Tax=Vibrio sagamiensis TaxID=512650 RepID=UPI000587A764|nr:DUF4440 domain-containing protein [Vibrio sagamiensis]PNQ54489.1 DUF4440 domain-containing protein [Vibrio agarivorans]
MENLKLKLINLEKHLFKAETRASYGELDKLISDDFTEIAGVGVRFGKTEVLSRQPSEPAPAIEASNFELRPLSPNCAQLLYQAMMLKSGETTPIFSLRSSIWSLNNGRWQMSYHQGTLCEPFEANTV